ncbi:MAG: tRNA pseudouridine(55) synthase TruB [Muribaculaceae bacterium]|nr:tRNA pseudouridine(55) synthase TruB [Muribaculaceae bacterium]
MNFIDGEILCVDKPVGWTSFDAVKRIRGSLVRRLGVRKIKVGHAGTLDPLASGVMLICTGRATRRIEELQAGVKVYEADLALGATTPSFDLETEIDATYPTDHITRAAVETALAGFVGTIEQIPPAYSACKIEGTRAYEFARKGEEVALRPKTLVIDSIELLEYSSTAIRIRVACSKGTYIRALARDIGQALGSGAHLTALRRTRVGDYDITDALTIAQAAELIKCVQIEMPETAADGGARG